MAPLDQWHKTLAQYREDMRRIGVPDPVRTPYLDAVATVRDALTSVRDALTGIGLNTHTLNSLTFSDLRLLVDMCGQS